MASVKYWAVLFVVTGAISALSLSVEAAEAPRIVIGIYADRDGTRTQDHRLFRAAEMPLNHLGLILEPYDILAQIPYIGGRDDVRGVLVWLERDDLPVPEETISFIEGAVNKHIPVIIMEEVPGTMAPGNIVTPARAQTTLSLIGVRGLGAFQSYTFDTKVADFDSEFVGFERNFDGIIPFYDIFTPTGDADAILTLERQDGTRSSPILITPQGAYVAPGFAVWDRNLTGYAEWYINPFALFDRVYDANKLPKPDPTTLSGRRVYYSQIDGDGWLNITSVEGYAARRALSAEVMLREMIAPYPDLPVTVAPIAADLDPRFSGTREAQIIARELFALPQVEPGSHTYTHPFQWSYFSPENYNPADELRYRRYYPKTLLGEGYDIGIAASGIGELEEEYVAPRAYGDIPFNLEREIAGSAAYISSFAPENKPVRLLQWSGDTEPFEEALAMTNNIGLVGINGGDTRKDNEFPSYITVAPYGRLVGGRRQIYASGANELLYTNGWTRNFGAFRQVLMTIANTDTPRRVSAANVYYHAFSGENEASVRAVKDVLDTIQQMELAPVTASRYAEFARGFYSMRFEEIAPLVWRVRDRGSLDTVRFDEASEMNIDYTRSEGILGDRHNSGSLYVALDSTNVAPLIVLKRAPAGIATGLILSDSRWEIWDLRRGVGTASFETSGFGPGEMHWRSPPDLNWNIEADYDGQLHSVNAESDSTGLLSFVLPGSAEESVSVRLTRVSR